MTGVFVPAGTPKAIVDKLQQRILGDRERRPTSRRSCCSSASRRKGNSPAEFAAYIKAEVAKWKKVIEDAKIKKIGS